MAITPPIALFNNLPINSDFYKPSQFFISAMTLGQTTTVTTSINHNYVIGQECKLIIPPTNGTRELNQSTGFVISIPAANQVVLSISSLGFSQFTTSSATTKPQILAIGDINQGSTNITPKQQTTFVQGSFINISPN